jgi:ferredoxin
MPPPSGIFARSGATRSIPILRKAQARLAFVTYIIAEPCIDIKDRSCVDVCPVDCIHEYGRILVIDPEECIDCGACEPECPVEAIFPEDALPDKWNAFVEINYAFPDAAKIDSLTDKYAEENDVHNEPLE